jgi:hypothetical protein
MITDLRQQLAASEAQAAKAGARLVLMRLELEQLRAVAEAALAFRQSQVERLTHAVIEGKRDVEGTRDILRRQVATRRRLDDALAALQPPVEAQP